MANQEHIINSGLGSIPSSKRWQSGGMLVVTILRSCIGNWLMRPEIAHDVIQTAQELAELLGISLAQVNEP
ncbi:hypothetical protein [Reticulibacter mediterranei]|nr:hypothetical protein [Reticulibacter mediterranei]